MTEPSKPTIDTYVAGRKLDNSMTDADKDKIKDLFADFNELDKKDKDGMSKEDRLITFGQFLWQYYEINRVFRRTKELEWLESLRQYKGLYDPEVKITKGLSRVYPKLTRSKENQILSRLMDMLFPEQDTNWEIEPTPSPKIDPVILKQIAIAMITKDEKGNMVLPQPQELKSAIMKYSKMKCAAMSVIIDDQLEEMGYQEEVKKVLRSGLRYGTGIMKGPLIHQRESREWEPGEDGEYTENVKLDDMPYKEQTRIWDYYPDMSTTEPEQMDGQFERHVMTKHDLRQLMKRQDFKADVIKEYMMEHPDGDYSPEDWEVDLQAIEIEAGTGKATSASGGSSARTAYGYLRKMGKKYVVLEYWGYVDGQDLESAGVEVTDPGLEHGANIWLLGKRPIKAKLYEGAIDMYNFFYYEKDETSIFGEGLPRVMRHSQLSIAAGARKVLDDAAIAGPQIECNYSMMVPGSDISDVYSRKIWYREGRGVEAQYPAIRIINIDPHTAELFMIVHEFKQFADEELCLPSWMMNQQSPNVPAQTSSGNKQEVTIAIKDVVKNFDAFTEKNIRDIYHWNMEFNKDKSIKGDYNVKARGVASLVMKEIRMQALSQLTATMTAEEWAYIPKRDFLTEKLKAHDIKMELYTEDEVAKKAQQQVDQRAKELMYKDAEAEVDKKKAQALLNTVKAKEKNKQADNLDVSAATDDASSQVDMAGKQMDIAGKGADIAGKQAEIANVHADTASKLADTHATMNPPPPNAPAAPTEGGGQ